MHYAIVESGGKQYKVSQGDLVTLEKLEGGVGEIVELPSVLAINEEGEIKVGNQALGAAVVKGEIIAHGKGKKILIFKHKRRKNYRRKTGHRQPFTKVKITEIALNATN